MHPFLRTLPALFWLLPFFFAPALAYGPAPDHLKCEFGVNPLGIDVPQPRLSWVLNEAPSEKGPGYRILVASDLQELSQNKGDLWDSGWVLGAQANTAAYAGKTLTSSQLCFWKVSDGTNWSEPATWTMGVLAQDDWRGAKWLGAPEGKNAVSTQGAKTEYESVLLRGAFSARSQIKRAVLQVCGLGQYEATVNGCPVTDSFLNPGWTMPTKTCLYNTYDVTKLVHSGENVVGLLLGNGMYLSHEGRYIKGEWSFSPLQAIALLHLELADGTRHDFVTDDHWKSHSGPITFSSIYGGEDYDARLVLKGWDQADSDVSNWESPAVLPGPGGVLRGFCSSGPSLEGFEVFQPAVIQDSSDKGRQLYDFGQNASMIVRLQVHGPAGSAVRMMPAEVAGRDASVNRGSVGGGDAWWQYTLAGTGEEFYVPKFFYQGARYIQVEAMPAPGGMEKPVIDQLEMQVIHAACEPIGTFSCSNDLFNRIYTLVRWAQCSNMVSVMTDCPTRERLGWLEEDHLNGPALRYNFDLARLFGKISQDMADSQRDNGLVPSTCPDYPHWDGDFADSPEWGSSCILVPWQSYLFLGDTDILSRNYDTMAKYVAYLKSRAHNGVLDYGLSDWYDIGPNGPGYSQLTPQKLSATAFYWEDTQLMAKIAAILHKDDDAKPYQQEADDIRVALNDAQFSSDTNQYGMGSQCGNSLALVMGFADPTRRNAIFANLVADVQKKGLTAGDVGYRYLIRALADGGRSDLLFNINNQSDKPGYGLQLKRGATSLTEAWDANSGSSQNHFMLGQINEWFYHDLAGIQPLEEAPGFTRFRIQPHVVGDLTWVKSSYRTVKGLIVSNWSLAQGKVKLEITVPFGSEAEVLVPTHNAGSVIVQPAGLAKTGTNSSAGLNLVVGPGNYLITADAIPAPPTGLYAKQVGAAAHLSWRASPGATTYTVARCTNGAQFSPIATGVTGTEFTDINVTIGTTYTYRVSSGTEPLAAQANVFIDTPNLVENGGFEQPEVQTYSYDVANAPGWTFSDHSGITPTSGDYWNGNSGSAPDGNQVAFLQMQGTITQVVSGLQPGKVYTVTFQAAQRVRYNAGGETWQLKADNALIGDFAPPESASSFAEYRATFTATADHVTLSFIGTNKNGGDNSVFIDHVRVDGKEWSSDR